VIRWNKGDRLPVGAHFKTWELECRCSLPTCKEQMIASELIHKLDKLRDELGEPLYVRSAFRCAGHQANLRAGGLQTAKGTSTHELGQAADIAARDMTRLEELAAKYFLAIGTARTFLHVDLRADRVRRWPY
jgi:uncharacterized protein YcbK (DUF882 family)